MLELDTCSDSHPFEQLDELEAMLANLSDSAPSSSSSDPKRLLLQRDDIIFTLSPVCTRSVH